MHGPRAPRSQSEHARHTRAGGVRQRHSRHDRRRSRSDGDQSRLNAASFSKQPRRRSWSIGAGRAHRRHRLHHHQPGGLHTHERRAARRAWPRSRCRSSKCTFRISTGASRFGITPIFPTSREGVICGLGVCGILASRFRTRSINRRRPGSTSAPRRARRPTATRQNNNGGLETHGPAQAQNLDRPGVGVEHLRTRDHRGGRQGAHREVGGRPRRLQHQAPEHAVWPTPSR